MRSDEHLDQRTEEMRPAEEIPHLTHYLFQEAERETYSHVPSEPPDMSPNSSLWVFLAMGKPNFTRELVSANETAIALPILMFAGGAAGNFVAIIVLSVSRQERKSSAFYALVRGLAVTDLLGTCLASPLTIANYLDPDVLRRRRVCEFHSFLLLFFGLAGLSIICAMAAERYLAICRPYAYRRWAVDRRFAQRFLFFLYASHVFFCCLPAMGMSGSALQPTLTWCFVDWRTEEPVAAAYSLLYGAVSLLLILGTIALNLAVCGALLLMRRRTATRAAARGSVRQRWRALSSAAETQMMAVLLTTSAVVLACSAPLVARVFSNCFMLKNDQNADLAAIRIASVNPILDPWIYILLRRSLFRRLLSLSRKGSRTGSTLTHSPQTNLFYPKLMTDDHVFGQLVANANIIAHLPASVKVTPHGTESLHQT